MEESMKLIELLLLFGMFLIALVSLIIGIIQISK